MEYISKGTISKIEVIKSEGIHSNNILDWCSISKIITAILVCNTEKFSVYGPDYEILFGKKIFSLGKLLTHTSGLPKIPHDTTSYDRYSKEQAENFVEKLPPLPEKKWEYSNLGYAILGSFLAREGINILDYFDNFHPNHTFEYLSFESSTDDPLKFWNKDEFWRGSGGVKTSLRDFESFLIAFTQKPGGHFFKFLDLCLSKDLIVKKDHFYFGPGFSFEHTKNGKVFQLQGANHYFQNNVFFNENNTCYVLTSDWNTNQREQIDQVLLKLSSA